MLSGGTALEQLASRRASSVLDALARRMPQVAHRKAATGLCDVRLGDIVIEDTLVVFPHEICPVDGIVIEGHGQINEAYLTGEPFEIAKTPGSQVLSGSVNGDAALHIRAERLAVDSRPSMSEILCAPGFTDEDVLRVTASLERYSKHPLSQSILEAAQKASLPELVSEMSERPGEGLRGTVGTRMVWITNRKKIPGRKIALPPVASGLECLVFLDGVYAATFRFHDMPRTDSRTFIRRLRPRHAFSRVLIVSGDRDQEEAAGRTSRNQGSVFRQESGRKGRYRPK
jgi:cation transport ATPase